MVIYQIYMNSFCKDFKDLTDKIPYFEELGVDMLWITPFYKSKSQHCYDTTDYKSVNERYGTIEDFENFVNKLHDKGIKLIIDLVLCHTSYHHTWFQESIVGRNDYYIWSDHEPENKYPTMFGDNSWRICKQNNKYYFAAANFDMPTLNLRNPKVREEVKSIIEFWFSKGIDGFRLDACPYVDLIENDPLEFWTWFAKEVRKIKPDAYMVAEAWLPQEEQAEYTKVLGHSFNFDMAGAMKDKIYHPNKHFELKYTEGDVFFLDNHDMSRVANGLDFHKLKGAYNMLFSMPGDKVLYYGGEVGMVGTTTATSSDHEVRRPMHWDAVCWQRHDPNSLFNYIKYLIKQYK